MKNSNFKKHSTKTATIMLLMLAGVSACKKNSKSGVSVTEADAVELTTDAVVPSTGGLTLQTTSSVNMYVAYSAKVSCGVKKDTTLTGSSQLGQVPAFTYTLNWDYTLDCDAIIPTQFTFNFTGTSTYSGTLMSANEASTGTFIISGIKPTDADYALSSTFERKGLHTSNIGAQKSFTSDLKITSTNILVDKLTEEIASGTATVSLTGTTSGGISFSFGGTITFLGNKKGTLVLNSGASYPLNWN